MRRRCGARGPARAARLAADGRHATERQVTGARRRHAGRPGAGSADDVPRRRGSAHDAQPRRRWTPGRRPSLRVRGVDAEGRQRCTAAGAAHHCGPWRWAGAADANGGNRLHEARDGRRLPCRLDRRGWRDAVLPVGLHHHNGCLPVSVRLRMSVLLSVSVLLPICIRRLHGLLAQTDLLLMRVEIHARERRMRLQALDLCERLAQAFPEVPVLLPQRRDARIVEVGLDTFLGIEELALLPASLRVPALGARGAAPAADGHGRGVEVSSAIEGHDDPRLEHLRREGRMRKPPTGLPDNGHFLVQGRFDTVALLLHFADLLVNQRLLPRRLRLGLLLLLVHLVGLRREALRLALALLDKAGRGLELLRELLLRVRELPLSLLRRLRLQLPRLLVSGLKLLDPLGQLLRGCLAFARRGAPGRLAGGAASGRRHAAGYSGKRSCVEGPPVRAQGE
mmetsp:Transcript_8466/g.24360  ORF Transcript_8466/g.24360 Transcript_8466/m.24360 type:complete len:452 (+) Transcript_8466:207-1562(+)